MISLPIAKSATPADEARFAAPLPAALAASDGSAITSATDWTARRRPETLELFRAHVYGRAPLDLSDKTRVEVLEVDASAFGGKAVRKRVRIAYGEGRDGAGGHIDVTLYTPKDRAPAACFLLIVNRSRRIIDDAEARPAEFWPAEDIIARGYATAAFHYSDVAVDRAESCFTSGVFAAHASQPRVGDSWGALGAWAWGASRVIDFLVAEPALAGKPLAVAGHSRGGKVALWCGAQDTRVALAISNNSGAGGAALARRPRGETIEASTRIFPYWYSENYYRYANNEAALPVDQHQLLALMAPRLVYVASAADDAWADPAAEFASCVEAAPVFKLFGADGVGDATMPAIDAPRHQGSVGYHLRAGKHDLTRHDWSLFMDFTDRHWSAPATVGK